MTMYEISIEDITDIEQAVYNQYVENRNLAIASVKNKWFRSHYTYKALRFYRLYRLIKNTGKCAISSLFITDEYIERDSKLTPTKFN